MIAPILTVTPAALSVDHESEENATNQPAHQNGFLRTKIGRNRLRLLIGRAIILSVRI